MHVQTQEAGNWWARSRGEIAQTWVANYQRSLQSPQRDAIVNLVAELGPVETVLEVGAHCGPNLVRLVQTFPHLRTLGVDINAEAVAAGRAWVTDLGLADRIQLTAGRVPAVLEALPTGSCDVVLSCYALAYLAPGDLDAVLYEMGRIAARAVIIAEPMVQGAVTTEPTRSFSGYHEWVHDYDQARQWIGSWHGMTTRIVPLVPPVDRLNAILVADRAALPSVETMK